MSPRGRVAEAVTLHLYGRDISTRKRAAAALHRGGGLADARQLFESLKDRNRRVAIRAAWGLSLLPPSVSLPLLAGTLKPGRVDEVELAAWALGSMRNAVARDLLVESLRHRSRVVRQAAAGGLWRWAVAGYRSEGAIRALRAMQGEDNGAAAIVLRHMLGAPRRFRVLDDFSKGRRGSVFERYGGAWIR